MKEVVYRMRARFCRRAYPDNTPPDDLFSLAAIPGERVTRPGPGTIYSR